MDEVTRCDACACFITKRKPRYSMRLQKIGGDAWVYTLCDKCAENLKQRIRNGELTEVE